MAMKFLGNNSSPAESVKRGRGRPRKYPVEPLGQQSIVPPTRRRLPQLSRQGIITLVIVVLAVIAAGYFYNQHRNDQKKLNQLQGTSQGKSELDQLTDKVGKLVVLPTGEQPSFTTLTQADLNKVKDQAFFARAAVGDKVLVYNSSHLAVIYRPSANRIIEAAPLNTTNQ